MKKMSMIDLIASWLILIGPLVIGGGFAIWGFSDGSKTLALWVG